MYEYRRNDYIYYIKHFNRNMLLKKEERINNFQVIVLGIIFDPKERKILIGRRENDPYFPNIRWVFPGGRLTEDGEINRALKEKIMEQTGLTVKNLGAVFSKRET